jgi:tetratricopeptide (TPR) repeat protein
MAQLNAQINQIAVAPLLGNQQTDEALWLGALLAKLLADHLRGLDLQVLDYDEIARQLTADKRSLPLDEEGADEARDTLNLSALVHGRYVLDEDGKMLGLSLFVAAPDIPQVPLEASAPLPGFSRFLDRVTLAVISQLGLKIDDELRQQIAALARPASFESLRQMARAQLAWSNGQTELALASVTSALSLDPDYEDAAALEVALAREAGDTAAVRDAFRRWSNIATKRQRPLVGADRLLALGHWLVERGEWDDARRAYEDARGIYQRQGDETRLAQAINDLGNLELLYGNFHNAIQAYRRNLRIFEGRAEHTIDSVATLYNLGLAHKSLGQFEEAERAIEQAITLARRLNDTSFEARCLAQRGAIFDEMGRWARADSDYAQAARLLDVLGDERVLAVVKTHQAILFKHQGAYDRAETLLLEAADLLEDQVAPYERGIVWLNLADLYLSMGVYQQSWDFAQQAHETLARLKSGWHRHARELLDTLESIPEERAESENEAPGSAHDLSPAEPFTLSHLPDNTTPLSSESFRESETPSNRPPNQGSDLPPAR